MGGIGDFLFGNKPQAGQPGTPGQIVDVTPDEFTALRGSIADALSPLFGGTSANVSGGTITGLGPAIDTSQFTVPLTGQEQSLLAGLGPGGSPLNAASRELLGSTIEGNFLSPNSNPFLADTIAAAQRPLLEAFSDVTLPQLRRGFTAAGQNIAPFGSSPFDQAAALSQRGLFNSLADIATNIAGANYQAERSRQQEAVNQSNALDVSDLQSQISKLQASALPRLVQQYGLDQGLAEFNARVQRLLEALQLGGALSSPTALALQPTQGTAGTPQGSSPFASLLTGAGSLLTGIGAL